MNPLAEWPEVARHIFWDRVVTLDAWRAGIAAGQRSYLPQSVKTMLPEHFIQFFGVAQFKTEWPRIRKHLSQQELARVALLDRFWSRLVSGSWNIKPLIDINTLPKREKEFLLAAIREPGITKYTLAKQLGMQYKRGHEYAKDLQAIGLIKLLAVKDDPRRRLRIYPA